MADPPAKKAAKPRKRVAKKRRTAPEHAIVPAPKGKTRGQYKEGSPAWVAAVERATKALELRKAGMSFDQIARQCGYANRGTAYKAVIRMLDAHAGEVSEHVRRLEAARLDTMFAAIYPRAIRGELLAVDRALKIMERRAAMLGTDAPIRYQQTVVTEEQILEAIAGFEAETELLRQASGFDDEDNIVEAEVVDEDDEGNAVIVDIAGKRTVIDGPDSA